MSKRYIERMVDISGFYITELPEFLSGLIVKGGFFASNNQLKTLKNAPAEVTGSFSCKDNKLTSLEGIPSIIGGPIDIRYNKLSSLKHSPSRIKGDFDCRYNMLKNLDFGPTIIVLPEEAKGNMNAAVFGYPTYASSYLCGYNNLTTLRGAPEMVPGSFDCQYNLLRDLTGAPKEVSKDFICTNQRARPGYDPVKFTEEQVRAVCKVGGRVYV